LVFPDFGFPLFLAASLAAFSSAAFASLASFKASPSGLISALDGLPFLAASAATAFSLLPAPQTIGGTPVIL